jgi:flagellar hook assembly protein FlgD
MRIFPNPVTDGPARIQLAFPPGVGEGQSLRLGIFNVAGRKMRSLADGRQPSGTWSVLWDGKDDAGRSLPTGIYFVHLEIGTDFQKTGRLVIVR